MIPIVGYVRSDEQNMKLCSQGFPIFNVIQNVIDIVCSYLQTGYVHLLAGVGDLHLTQTLQVHERSDFVHSSICRNCTLFINTSLFFVIVTGDQEDIKKSKS